VVVGLPAVRPEVSKGERQSEVGLPAVRPEVSKGERQSEMFVVRYLTADVLGILTHSHHRPAFNGGILNLFNPVTEAHLGLA